MTSVQEKQLSEASSWGLGLLLPRARSLSNMIGLELLIFRKIEMIISCSNRLIYFNRMAH